LAQVVLTPWLFAIFIVTNSFTASLTSITISQVKSSVLDIQTLKERNLPVGCNGNSFIVKYLSEVLKFKPESTHVRVSSKQETLSSLVAPHAKVFLAKYSCKGLIKAGNTFKLGGFGFVSFSPLIYHRFLTFWLYFSKTELTFVLYFSV